MASACAGADPASELLAAALQEEAEDDDNGGEVKGRHGQGPAGGRGGSAENQGRLGGVGGGVRGGEGVGEGRVGGGSGVQATWLLGGLEDVEGDDLDLDRQLASSEEGSEVGNDRTNEEDGEGGVGGGGVAVTVGEIAKDVPQDEGDSDGDEEDGEAFDDIGLDTSGIELQQGSIMKAVKSSHIADGDNADVDDDEDDDDGGDDDDDAFFDPETLWVGGDAGIGAPTSITYEPTGYWIPSPKELDFLPSTAAIASSSSSALFPFNSRLVAYPDRTVRWPRLQPLCFKTSQQHASREALLDGIIDEKEREAERMDPAIAVLKSDMSAFKAANPGCAFVDFVRWYSPHDYSSNSYNNNTSSSSLAFFSSSSSSSSTSSRSDLSSPSGASSSSSSSSSSSLSAFEQSRALRAAFECLSPRMQLLSPSNPWHIAWLSAPPKPAHEQIQHRDWIAEAEEALDELVRIVALTCFV